MECCGFGRVLQTVLVSTYESKMIGMMYGRIGWMALCSDIFLELR